MQETSTVSSFSPWMHTAVANSFRKTPQVRRLRKANVALSVIPSYIFWKPHRVCVDRGIRYCDDGCLVCVKRERPRFTTARNIGIKLITILFFKIVFV